MVTQKWMRTCRATLVIWSVQSIDSDQQRAAIEFFKVNVKRPIFLHTCATFSFLLSATRTMPEPHRKNASEAFLAFFNCSTREHKSQRFKHIAAPVGRIYTVAYIFSKNIFSLDIENPRKIRSKIREDWVRCLNRQWMKILWT